MSVWEAKECSHISSHPWADSKSKTTAPGEQGITVATELCLRTGKVMFRQILPASIHSPMPAFTASASPPVPKEGTVAPAIGITC